MSSESLSSTVSSPLPRNPFWMNPQIVPDDRGIQLRNICFNCHQEGHWFRDCPSRQPPSPAAGFSAYPEPRPGIPSPTTGAAGFVARPELLRTSSGPSRPAAGAVGVAACPEVRTGLPMTSPGLPSPAAGAAGFTVYPELHCGCGACLVLTSHTDKNPGRQFYRCPLTPIEGKCTFFKWCDEVVSGQSPVKANSPLNPEQRYGFNRPVNRELQYDVYSPKKSVKRHCDSGESSYPMCSCSAGRCRIWTMEGGEFHGRHYFGCPIKKGQGACNFLQWRNNGAIPPETKNEESDAVKVPDFSLVPEEPKSEIEVIGAGEVKDYNKPEGMISDVSVVPASPLPSREQHPYRGTTPFPPSREQQQPYHVGDELSPIKRLSLDEGSPATVRSRPGKCFKCGIEGHWMSECVGPYIKCGKTGHWRRDCTS